MIDKDEMTKHLNKHPEITAKNFKQFLPIFSNVENKTPEELREIYTAWTRLDRHPKIPIDIVDDSGKIIAILPPRVVSTNSDENRRELSQSLSLASNLQGKNPARFNSVMKNKVRNAVKGTYSRGKLSEEGLQEIQKLVEYYNNGTISTRQPTLEIGAFNDNITFDDDW